MFHALENNFEKSVLIYLLAKYLIQIVMFYCIPISIGAENRSLVFYGAA